MSLSKQKFREIVFQLLYSYDMNKTEEEDHLELLAKELNVSIDHIRQAHVRMQSIYSMLPQIDSFITKTSSSYDFDRIQSVERNILRLGVFELLFDDNIPDKVAISEAIRLSRKYATSASAIFINAVLDSIYKKHEGKDIDEKDLNAAAALLQEQNEIPLPAIKPSDEEEDED